MHPHSHSGANSHDALGSAAASASLESRTDPRVELLGLLLAIAAIGSEPLGQLTAFAFYLPLVAAYVFLRERALWPVLRRLAPVLPVLAILALGLPLSRGIDSWLGDSWLGDSWLGAAPARAVDQAGWAAALSLFLRAFSAVVLVSTLVQSMGFARILMALRRLRLPLAVVLTLQHLERYRALIAEEWRRTNQAREARSPGGAQFAFASYANQTSLIFLRSWERSERIHTAMVARGFRIDAPLPPATGEPASPGRALLHSGWLPALALLIRLAV